MRKTFLILCAAGTLLVAGCDRHEGKAKEAGADTQAIADAIRQNEKQGLADWTAKDAAKVASHYTDDAQLMMPGMAPLSGPGKIQPAVDAAVKDPNFSLSFQAEKVEAAQSGEIAYSRGTFSESYTDPKTRQKVSDSGSYLTIWKKQSDGSWKISEDIVTPGAPAAAGQTSSG